MPNFREKISRREALSGLVILPALAGVLISTTTVAEAKITQATAGYQTHPNHGLQCSGCRFFQPGRTPKTGSCSVVAGVISAKGWCTSFVAK